MLSSIQDFQFQNPSAFLLLLPVVYWFYWKYKKKADKRVKVRLSNINNELLKHKSWRIYLKKYVLPFLNIASLVFLVMAIARPQLTLKEENINAEGIDIVLVMDLSSSMLAQDFKPNRLEVSKRVAADFVTKRPHDRVGLTVFAGEAFTQCPLTTDHAVFQSFLSKLECGMLKDGTAIGMGLATAVNRLSNSEAKSKIVILLTDGVNNSGYIQPLTAVEVAKEYGVKVYPIGVGTNGQAPMPVSRMRNGKYLFGMAAVEIDEQLLNEIAMVTGGKYFRATNEKSLEDIYNYIDQLEKTKIEVTTIKRYSEEFYRFAIIAFGLLILQLLLRFFVLKSIP